MKIYIEMARQAVNRDRCEQRVGYLAASRNESLTAHDLDILSVYASTWENTARSNRGSTLEQATARLVTDELIPHINAHHSDWGETVYKQQWVPSGVMRGAGTDPLDGLLLNSHIAIGFSPKYKGSAGGALKLWTEELRMLQDAFAGRLVRHVAVKGMDRKFPVECTERGITCLTLGDELGVESFLKVLKLEFAKRYAERKRSSPVPGGERQRGRGPVAVSVQQPRLQFPGVTSGGQDAEI